MPHWALGHCSFAAVPLLAALLWHLWDESPARQLCRDLSTFTWDNTFLPNHAIRRSFPGAFKRFVEACEAELAATSGEQREVLLPLLGAPLPENVLRPPPADVQLAAASSARAAVLAEGPSVRLLPRGPSTASLRRTIEERHRGPPISWLKELALPGEDSSAVDVIEPSEVLSALQHGRIATFDATKLLPAWMFNLTLDEIVAGQRSAEGSSDVGTGASAARPFWTGREKACAAWCAASPVCRTLELERLLCPSAVPDWCQEAPERECDYIVNARRVPHFVNLDAQVLRALGFESWVERTEGQLFWGSPPNPGLPHWDEQDNIMFTLSGITVVWVVSSNYTDAVSGRKQPLGPWSDNLWVTDGVPYHKVLLLPGDALVIPSRSYHWFRSSPDRVGLNSFFEPKFSHPGWPMSAPGGFWHRESRERRALRNLWLRATARLWETQRLSMFLQGLIEFL